MSLFRKRNLLVGVAAFVIGIGAFSIIWGVPTLFKRSATTQGQVSAYLLDDRGKICGLLLSSGDQLHFSPQTGEAVATQIKVGDAVTATGRAGYKTNYGRNVEVEQLSANGRTIVEAEMGRRHPGGPPEPGERRGPKGERPGRRPRDGDSELNAGPADPPVNEQTENLPSAPPNTVKAAGTIKTHLVNHRGEVDGLILSSGEQLLFSPRLGELVIAAEQGAETQVSAEGSGVTNESGTVIHPNQISVGAQTIAQER